MRDKELAEICPAARELKDVFENAEKAAQTSAWLDETFNGDFLRLIDESIPASIVKKDRMPTSPTIEGSKKKPDRILSPPGRHPQGWRPKGKVYQQELD